MKSKRGKIGIHTDLGLAILIEDLPKGKYRPIAVCSSVNEARQITGARESKITHAFAKYSLWARGADGEYEEIQTAL